MLMRLRMLALQLVQALEGVVDAADDPVERGLRNAGVATEAVQLRAVALEFLQQVALDVGTRGHVHDLEKGGEREMMVHRRVARHQLAEAVEQVLEPQHRADAFVEGVLVQDQGGLG
jgi:hypothetical protein